MKPCPECGALMRLAMGQWVHQARGVCRTLSLRATEEEVRRYGAVPVRGPRETIPRWESGQRFRYLSTEGLKNPPGGTANEGGIPPSVTE
jgi:hypothetical protein